MAVSSYELGALILFVFRYLRLVVNLISHWTYQNIPIPETPTYTPKDVTVIIPTIEGDGQGLRRTIQTCLITEPLEVIIVTIDANVKKALQLAAEISPNRTRVLSVAKANKRRQMCRAIPEVVTRITVFADDDVIWPTTVLPWMLAPFEDDAVGAVGTSQRLVRPERPTIWSFLGACYLERRNFDCSACLHIDGGLPCLSGRTAAYRTSILQDEDFTFGFTNETWGTCQLNADDDNFMTRWMYKHGWKIKMQYHKAAEIKTTLAEGWTYTAQCLRWVRSNWRSNITSLFIERHYWWTQPWSTYAVLQTTFTAWAPVDPLLFFLIYKASDPWPADLQFAARLFAVVWIFLFAKCVKLMGHFMRYPSDFPMLIVSIAFGYYHCFIKIQGLLTLSETTWGSRKTEGADDDNRLRMIRLPGYLGNYGQHIQAKQQSVPEVRGGTQMLPPYHD